MPLLTISSPSTIKKCANLPLRSDDIFICSYPKSGTTWTQHIIISLLILHREKTGKNSSSNLSYDHVSDYAPFFEIDPHWNGEELAEDIRKRHSDFGRRVFNTHLRYDMLPKDSSGKGKIIYITRSPLDVCVSFYHHLSHQVEGCYERSLQDFFQEWLDGKLPFGSWADHILSYAPGIAKGKVFFLSYEEMVCDLSTSVKRLTSFLELDEHLSTEDVEKILPSFSFECMKNDLNRFQPQSVTWKNKFKFLRKGKVGDHKEALSSEEKSAFKQSLITKNFFENILSFDSKSDAFEKIMKNM